jgi:hypothetical protein
MHGRISHKHVVRKAVGCAVNSSGRDLSVPARMNYSYSGNPAIRYKYLFDFSAHGSGIYYISL